MARNFNQATSSAETPRCVAAAAADADVASRPQAAAQLLHDSTAPLPLPLSQTQLTSQMAAKNVVN